MLSDAEYADREGVDPTLFEGEVDVFSWFTLPIGGEDGPPLWHIKPHPKRGVTTHPKEALLEKYIRQGYAFDPRAK